jgi:hypothetical protein
MQNATNLRQHLPMFAGAKKVEMNETQMLMMKNMV